LKISSLVESAQQAHLDADVAACGQSESESAKAGMWRDRNQPDLACSPSSRDKVDHHQQQHHDHHGHENDEDKDNNNNGEIVVGYDAGNRVSGDSDVCARFCAVL
jgi:hypothetical protein